MGASDSMVGRVPYRAEILDSVSGSVGIKDEGCGAASLAFGLLAVEDDGWGGRSACVAWRSSRD